MGSKKRCQINASSTPQKKEFYFYIFYDIKQGLNPSQIAKKYKLSRQLISWYIKDLRLNGYIEKIGYGTWKIKKELKKDVKLMPQDTCQIETHKKHKKIRGHAYTLRLKIPQIPKWDQREKFLQNKKITYKTIGTYKNIYSITLKKHKIWLCKDSIIIYFPKYLSFFNFSASESEKQAIFHFLDLVHGLESLFKISLRIKKKHIFSICRSEYALIKNPLASKYNQEAKKLQVKDREGNLWLLIDNSYNLDEIETVHAKTSKVDMDNIIHKFFNELRETELTPKLMMSSIYAVSKNQEHFAENMSSHVEAIQKISESQEKLNESIQLLNQYIIKLTHNLETKKGKTI